MSDESQMIKDIAFRLSKIEERLTKIEVATGKLEAGQKVTGMIGGAAVTGVAGLLLQLLLMT